MSRVESGDWAVCSAGEGGGSSPEMPQVLQSSKKLPNDSFSKLFVRVSGCGSACVSSPRRSGAPKSFKTIAFQCFSQRFSDANLGAALGLSFLCSPFTRVMRKTMIVSGLLWEYHFLAISPFTRVMRRTMIVSGLLWECHFLAISPFTCVMRRTY